LTEYDAIVKDYKFISGSTRKIYAYDYSLLRLLGNVNGSDVVDYACGDGVITREIKLPGNWKERLAKR